MITIEMSINSRKYKHVAVSSHNGKLFSSDSQEYGPWTSCLSITGNLSGRQILGPLFRPSELEIPEVRLNAVLTSPSYDSDTLNFGKHWLTVFNMNKL